MTQCEKVIEYMKKHGSITTIEAFTELGIARLASRIHDLCAAGYEIEKKSISVENRYGEKVHCTKYSLKR